MSLGNGAAADDSLNGAGGDGAALSGVNGSVPDAGAASSSGAGAGAGAENHSYVLRDLLRARDYDIDDTMHDDALVQQFESWADQAQRFEALGDVDPAELQRYADIGRRLGPYESQIEQLRQQAQAGQQRAQAAAPATAAQAPAQSGMVVSGQGGATPQPNQYSREAIQAARATCRQNSETGLWEPLQPFYADAAKFLNDVQMHAERNKERILLQPDDWYDEQWTPRAQRLRDEIRQELMQELMPDIEAWREFSRAQMQQQFLSPFESELIAARDETTGQLTLTPKGVVFDKAYAEAPQTLSEIERLNHAKAVADQWELYQSRQPAAPAASGPFRLTKKKPGATPAAPAAGAASPAAPAAESDKPRDRRGRFIEAARHSQRNGQATLPVQDRAATVRAAARRVGGRDPLPSYEELYEQNARALGH